MKQIKVILYFALLLFIVPFVSSCSDDEIVKNGTYNIKEGVPVTVSLNLNVSKSDIVSRSAASEAEEQTINRIYVIAFTSSGNVSGRKYYWLEDPDTDGQGEITEFEMLSGADQQLFVIGNPVAFGETMYSKLEALSTIEEFKALAVTLEDEGAQSVERSTFMMVGQLKNTEGGIEIAVNEQGSFVNVANPATVTLERIDARISFTVIAENNQYTNMEFTPRYCNIFNASRKSYIVPQDKDYAEDHSDEEDNYGDVTSYYFDGGNNEDGYTIEFYLLENRLTYKQQITSAIKNETYSEAENLYALREKRAKDDTKTPDGSKPGQEYVLGDFIFANEHSTYVQLRGTLTYMDENNDQVIADVTYTIHLGNTGNRTANGNEWYNNESLVNNYETKRNTHYKYKVTITGVSTLKVEVKDDEEKRPGAEGDVIVAGEDIVNFDSHYGRKKFTLDRDAIKNGLSWAFSTPFQRGIKVFSKAYYTTDETESGAIGTEDDLKNREQLKTGINLNDYKWVQFVINKECGVSIDEYAKYPGYKAYAGGSGESENAPAFGGEGIQPADKEHYPSQTVVMYDVNQLLNHLYLEANSSTSTIFDKNNDGIETVTITAFVDEYIYKYNPKEIFYEEPDAVASDDPDLSLWKEVVNGDNRLLHICKEGAQYSPDGNSSWSESVITFSQCPVYTFYNPNSDVETAWGTESIMETDALPIESTNMPPNSGSNINNTPDNGRINTLNILKGEYGSSKQIKWSDVLHLEARFAESDDGNRNLKSDYNSIWYACLGRNRDLNGDDIVQENEIRWYLASIDQLTDLWIGDQAVPNAKLYQETATQSSVPLVHIASSTYHKNSPNTPWIIWAEEGASRGAYNQSGDDKTPGNGERYYRCIRNLGLSLNDIDKVVDDYVQGENGDYIYEREVGQYRATTYGEKWIDVSRLEQNVLRAYRPNMLPNGNVEERSDNNRPYTRFAMLVTQQEWNDRDAKDALYPLDESGSWETYYKGERVGTPCPQGYRIPNQRELMLMYTTYPDYFSPVRYDMTFNWDFMCKTAFSYNGWGNYGNNRYGFSYDIGTSDRNVDGNMILMTGNTNVRVRCVRDVPNDEVRNDFPAK